MAGYSLGEADLLRRAMGKKNAEEMAKQRARFVEGAKANGHPPRKIEKIFDLMEKFAGYGFNKSHSAAYAYLAFVTAYLKTHYPVEFMSALLTSETGNTSQVVKYINECREMGIRVLPPDVNSSEFDFTPSMATAILFGLGAIKNVGASAVESIVQARLKDGAFRFTLRFLRARRPGRGQPAHDRKPDQGRRDGYAGRHARAVDGRDRQRHGDRRPRAQGSGKRTIRSVRRADRRAARSEHALPKVKDWTGQEKLTGEKEMLGFYITGHPLDQFIGQSEGARHAHHRTSGRSGKNTEVALCGILTGIQRRRSKEGKAVGLDADRGSGRRGRRRWSSPRNMSA